MPIFSNEDKDAKKKGLSNENIDKDKKNIYQAEKNDHKAEKNDSKNKNDKNNESNKKAAKTAAKGAANAAFGPMGGKAVDAISKTKAGDKLLNKGGELLGKIPGISKATKKLDDSGALDAADKGMSAMGGGATPGVGATNNAAQQQASTNDAPGFSGFGKGNSKNKGGLGKPSSLDGDNLENPDQIDNNDKQGEGDFSANLSGTGFLPGGKKTLLIIGVVCFIFLFMSGGILTSIGSADNNDAKNDIGNPDRKGAKGTKYESQIIDNPNSSVNAGGICTYDIKGSTNGVSVTNFNEQVTDIKVRLMHSSFCDGTDNVPIEGESLIDFETYILGVVYAEVGGGMNEAEAKTQAIAARSFILDRAIRGVNKANGVKLENEDGQWVLQVRNCVADQVFCNPDQGCSKRGASDNQYQDVYSGINNIITYKPPLSQNAKSRQWVAETTGQLLVNNSGYIVGTNYASSRQKEWRTWGAILDYKQVLLQSYGSNKDIYTANCSGGATSTGDYTTWKQYGAPWSSITLGNSSATINNAGCLATSISMLIAKSGVATSVEGEFNPGTFVQQLNKSGGFDGRGNLQWNVVSSAAPNFKYQGKINVANDSRKNKLASIQSLLNSGYYVVAEVKGNTGQHWVAIDSVNGDTVNMFDPASTSTNMWQQYNWKNTSRLAYFKVV